MSYPIKPSADNILSESNIFASSGNKIPMTSGELLGGYSRKNEVQTDLTSQPDAHKMNSFLYQAHNTIAWLIGYVEALFENKLNLSGGTMTGNIAMGSNKVTSSATPSSASDLTNKQYVDDIAGSSWFLGEYKTFDYPVAPSLPAGIEVIEADGRLLNRTTYATYFARVGTTYGAGDGSTTFNAPDRRGIFARGWDNGRGLDYDHAFGAYQEDSFQGHYHRFADGTFGDGPLGSSGGLCSRKGYGPLSGTHTANTPITDGSNGTPRISSETRPKNISEYVMVRIK